MKNINLKQLIKFNVICLFCYFLIFFNLDLTINSDLLFLTTDSKEYLYTSTEFFSFDTGYSYTRPFLYPLIIIFTYYPFGAFGLWFIQFIFWIGSVNLIFLTLVKLTQHITFSFIASFLFIINITIIVLTFHGLTELTTIFLLSILSYYLSKYLSSIRTLKVLHVSLFLLTLLTVVKPLFYLPFLFVLFIICPIFYWREYKKTPKKLAQLFLVLLPLLFQMSMMKMKYDKFTVSEISSLTFKKYILAQIIERKDGVSRDCSIIMANEIKPSEIRSFITQHKFHFNILFFQNLTANINGDPSYLSIPKNHEHPKFKKFMIKLNSFYYQVHFIAISPLLICLLILLFKKEFAKSIFIFALSSCVLYIFLTSGISFWQGDRLTIIAVPLFTIIYGYLIYFYFTFFKSIYFKYKNS